MSELVQILVLAVVAGIVLARLVSVLGRRTGAEPPPKPQPVQGPAAPDLRTPLQPARVRESAPLELEAVARADAGFDAEKFMAGARQAYELIVVAFAKGDKAALQPLLSAPVYEAYAAAIDARAGEPGPELVRLKRAAVHESEVEHDVARIEVRFEAELAEGAVGVRDTRELWTFERNVRSKDPTWRLVSVAQG